MKCGQYSKLNKRGEKHRSTNTNIQRLLSYFFRYACPAILQIKGGWIPISYLASGQHVIWWIVLFSQLIFNILIELWTAFSVAQINIDQCSTKGGVTSCRSLLLNWDWDQLSKIDHEILWDLIKHKKMIYYIDQFDIPIHTSVVSC